MIVGIGISTPSSMAMRVEGDVKRVTIEEFNSNNTKRLNLEETKAKIAGLEYIQNELKGIPNVAK